MTAILLMGLLLGMRHALETDHVAAVAVLATRAKGIRQALPLGLMWGLGHTLTLAVFGIAVLAMDAVISDGLAHWLEGAVGIMLIVLGGDVLVRLVRERIHFHVHRHAGGNVHVHAHSHLGERRLGDGPHAHRPHTHIHPARMPLRALGVGVMHGMAGSAALVLLTLQTVDSTLTGVFYILLFGFGSMLGMAALSLVIAVPLRMAERSLSRGYGALTAILGCFSVGLGLLNLQHAGLFS